MTINQNLNLELYKNIQYNKIHISGRTFKNENLTHYMRRNDTTVQLECHWSEGVLMFV